MAGPRPGGVTLIAVIAWINGLIGIIGGVVALGSVGNIAWIAIALGALTLAVGVGLLRGNNVARVLATIVFALNVLNSILILTQGGTLWSAIASGGLSLIALILLYTKRSNDFFRA